MKAAVLGVGGMGRGPMSECRESGLFTDVIGYDIDPASFEWMKENNHSCSENLDAILDDPEVGLVFVTSSNGAHKPLVMAALKAGKAVMCEKPIATTLADAREMVEEAEKRGLFFQIGFELRYSKLYMMVKDWADQGVLGEVMNTQCTYICSEFHHKGSWRNKLATGGGMFGEKLSHYVDLPRWWIGSRVTEVYSACAPNVIPYYEVRDNYHTSYKFENGAVSQLTFHMAVGETFDGDPLRDHIEQQKEDGHALRYLIVGTKGAASLDVFHRRIKFTVTSKADSLFPVVSAASIVAKVARDFLLAHWQFCEKQCAAREHEFGCGYPGACAVIVDLMWCGGQSRLVCACCHC